MKEKEETLVGDILTAREYKKLEDISKGTNYSCVYSYVDTCLQQMERIKEVLLEHEKFLRNIEAKLIPYSIKHNKGDNK